MHAAMEYSHRSCRIVANRNKLQRFLEHLKTWDSKRISMGFLRDSWWFWVEWMCVWMNNWTRFACCRCYLPDCSKTYGKALIPSSEAPKPKEYQCFWAGWTCVRMNNWTRFVVAGVTLQIVPTPMEHHWFRALRLQHLRNTNASELNGSAYEWTTEQGLHVAGVTLQIAPKPVENHWFRGLRLQKLRNINASELDERVYEWTTEQGL